MGQVTVGLCCIEEVFYSRCVPNLYISPTFNHRLYTDEHSPLAEDDVAAAVEQTRALDSVDPDRIGLVLLRRRRTGRKLARRSPDWLALVAWAYPVLVPPPDWSGDRERFDVVNAASSSLRPSKLLLRVGDEYEYFAETQNVFVESMRQQNGALEVIDLPEAEHGFEHLGYAELSRDGVDRAMRWVANTPLN